MSKTWRKSSSVFFELTNDMAHEVITNDDNKTDWLHAGKKGTQGDWAFSCTVQTEDTRIKSDDKARPSDSPMQVFCSRLANGSVVEGGYSNGKAAFFIEKRPIRLFDIFIKLYRVGIAFESGPHEVTTIEKNSGPDDEPMPLNVDEAKWLIELGKSVRVNGRPLSLAGADAKRLSKKMKVNFDAENDESAVDLKFGLTFGVSGEEINGGVISASEAPAKKTERKANSPDKKKTAARSRKAATGNRRITERDSGKVIRERKTISANDVLLLDKFMGIHNVTDKLETISPYGTWTMDVPAGFSYTMDPECASRSMTGSAYPLQIQTTEDCDFSNAYKSSFGLAIYPLSVVWVNIEDGGEDLRSSYAQSTLRDLQNNYTVLIHTQDVLVQYDNSNRDSEAITISFQIISAGVNAGTIGQIDVHGPDMYKLEKKALEMLASVGSVRQEYNTDRYVPFAIPSKVTPVLKTPETIEIAPGVKLPIPDGFHATNNQSLTNGRSFIIVPEAYPFSKDPMQAIVGISGANGNINLPDQYNYGMVFRAILAQLPDGVFFENNKIWFSRISGTYAAFFQENYDEDSPTWALYRIMLFAGQQAFIMTMRINFGSSKVPFQATSIDARNIVRHWLYHIVTRSNFRESIPIALPKVPDVFYEHLTLVTSGQYTTHRDADFVGQPIRMLMEKLDNVGEEAYDLMEIPDDDYVLDAEARRLATIFRMDEGLFDPYRDTEAMIRLGMFLDVKMFHALRSLAWTVNCKADREGRTLDSYSIDELREIAESLETNHLNYSTESWCSGLCSHYDWHVFYVPDAYIKSDCRDNTDLRLLCGKENRGGNSISIMMPGLGGFGAMNRVNELISRCEETLESLEALRKDLIDLLPVMQTIYDGFMQNRDRSQPLEGVLAEALTAWCALAIAAKEPFYSEEATDTPEADAGLDGPMERPTDDLDAATVARKTSTASKPIAKKPSCPLPAGEVLDLGGATVVEASKFSGNMTLKNIIIPEGVTEIGEYAFYSCMFLETVVLPKSLKKIGQFAFMSCRALRQVEIPEGVEQIDTHAFGATNNLKEVHLPDSLKIVDRHIFGMGGDSPYATAYMSGELAKRLQAESGDSQWLSAISARRYVINGKGYQNMYDYNKPPSLMDTDERKKRKAQYRPDMEAAISEGKSLDEVIEASRKVLQSDPYADVEAFENAIKNLDRDAVIQFKDKHFALTGFGDNENEVIAEIEKRGGEVHSKMVKKADYLVVCLREPGASKVNSALEWRQKGATNLIVSDYQMWQAMLGGKTKKAVRKPTKEQSETVSQAEVKKTSASDRSTIAQKAFVKKDQKEDHSYIFHDEIIIKDKLFVFSGIGAQDSPPLAERLEMAGGQLRQDVNRKTDYLVVRSLDGKESAKLKKALDYKGKGQDLKIVLLEQLENTLNSLGVTDDVLKAKKKREAEERKREAEERECELHKDRVLNLGSTSVIEEQQFSFSKLDALGKVIIPEGMTEIKENAFFSAQMSEVEFPTSLRKIGYFAFYSCSNLEKIELKKGIEEIGTFAFEHCDKLQEVYLPDSLKIVERTAFVTDDSDVSNYRSSITLRLSGRLARYLDEHNPYSGLTVIIAKEFIIDGKRYASISEYAKAAREEERRQREAEERERRERARREREAAERRAAEERKKAERERINAEIYDLSQEMDSIKGLFAGMKRKKLQKRIDELNEQLRRL